MSKHTPGPWTAQRDPGAVMADDWCIGAGGQIDMVAVCSERDAHLIAAAPDLLEALQELKEELFRHAEGNYFRPFLDKAEDAIAKAKGETE